MAKGDLNLARSRLGIAERDLANTRLTAPFDGVVASRDVEPFEEASKVAEPAEIVRGDVARAWLYMSETYGIRLSREERTLFEEWREADPVDAWERLRDERIEAIQGNRNEWVTP